MSFININIDGKEIKSFSELTILEIARENGIDIPTLCQNEKIKNFGSCGICVVEVAGNPRLVRSCSTLAHNGMIISTQTKRVKASRKTTLELLLSDHTGDCKAPCSNGCPGKVDVQGYVGLIANKAYDEALQLIKEQLPFPASVGRVCPHPCQTSCRRDLVEDPISIAWLKRYVADLDLAKENPYIPELKPNTGKKIAVIGGGPSGLSAAYYLATEGHQVEVFEGMPEFGGMLKYGIPLYRLPKEVLLGEIKIIEKMGVKLTPNKRIGKDLTLEHIRAQHDAVYVSIGAWQSAKLNVPGDHLDGVIGGIDFLTKFAVNEPVKTGDRIAVIGGGNTAMDACRTAKRLGAKKVYAIYRRTKEDMPATDIEIIEAEEEGIEFKFLLNPSEVIDNGSGGVAQIRLQKMQIVVDEKTGRRTVVAVEGEDELLEVDSVIVSIGQKLKNEGLEEIAVNSWGNMLANAETFETNLSGVFAGGDATNKGADIAISAIADGKYAARAIHSYLNGALKAQVQPFYVKQELKQADLAHVEKIARAHMGHEAPELRITNFEEVVHGYTEAEANLESNRCLECGCHDYFECELVKQTNLHDIKDLRFEGDKHALVFKDDHSFIKRDPNKCILCGMCVRICDEVTDQTALGLVNRGFETVVLPALEKKLEATNCISCGQCVMVCPTGALIEKQSLKKPVPLMETQTQTTCFGCSVGCQVNIASKGTLLLRALPVNGNSVNKGLLCSTGRFGYDAYRQGERITEPMIRKDGVLTPVDLKEALLYISRKAQSIQLRYGHDSLGLSVSAGYTLEEMFMIKSFGQNILNTNNIFAFNQRKSGLESVLGRDTTANQIEELVHTDLIWVVGMDPIKDSSVLGFKIKEAVNNGAKLIQCHDQKSKIDRFASQKYLIDESSTLLLEVLKIMTEDLKHMPEGIQEEELKTLKESLEFIQPSDNAKKIAHSIVQLKHMMIVFDESKITFEAEKTLAMIAVLSGHVNKPRNGLLKLRSNFNSQGLTYLGIEAYENHVASNNRTSLKALLNFGENIDLDLIEGLEFLMVQESHMTELASKADVIIPKASYLETTGHVISMERRIQMLAPVFKAPLGIENWEVLKDLMNTYSTNCNFNSSNEIFEALCKTYPVFRGLHLKSETALYAPERKNADNDTNISYHVGPIASKQIFNQ